MSTKFAPDVYTWQVQFATSPFRTQGSAWFFGLIPVGFGGPEKKQSAYASPLQ